MTPAETIERLEAVREWHVLQRDVSFSDDKRKAHAGFIPVIESAIAALRESSPSAIGAIDETPLTDEFEADEEDGFKRGWKRWPIFARMLEKRMRQLHTVAFPDCAVASPPEAATTWQPIETAPKDGTEILVWRKDCGILLARYISPSEFLTEKECEEIGESSDTPDWFCADLVSGSRLDGDLEPTHWTNLPLFPDIPPMNSLPHRGPK